jgi:4-nitrophenyl phosphatase
LFNEGTQAVRSLKLSVRKRGRRSASLRGKRIPASFFENFSGRYCTLAFFERLSHANQKRSQISRSFLSSFAQIFFLKVMIMSLPDPINGLILDMDGVLWRDSQPMLDMPAFFSGVAELGIPVVYATNNGTRSVDMYVERLAKFGVTAEPWQVVTSAIATADALSKRFPQGGPVYVVGEVGVQQALQEKGFEIIDDRHSEAQAAGCIAVVAGMDRSFSYEKMARAALLIRAGVPFIGTNIDVTFPTPRGLVPGAGSLLAMLEAATEVPPTLIGKPEPYLYEFSIERLGTLPAETLAVGDRLETDILGGQRTGCPTLLVLTGVTTREQAAAWQPQPDLILPNLADLLPLLLQMRSAAR